MSRALEEKKKEQQNNEEQIRDEVLAKRKQEQQEATQRFQKDTVHKKKLKPHDHVNGTDKGTVTMPFSYMQTLLKSVVTFFAAVGPKRTSQETEIRLYRFKGHVHVL